MYVYIFVAADKVKKPIRLLHVLSSAQYSTEAVFVTFSLSLIFHHNKEEISETNGEEAKRGRRPAGWP